MNDRALKIRLLRFSLLLIGLLVYHLTTVTAVSGQSPTDTWSDPLVVSSTTDLCRIRPLMAADSSGRVHAIWHEAREAGDACVIDSIYYSMWDGLTWSEPVDVIVAPRPGGISLARSFLITNDGLLVVAWSAGGDMFLSQVPIQAASTVHAWASTPIGSGTDPVLAISSDAIWALSYWQDQSVLATSLSLDHGKTWEKQMLIWSADDNAAGDNVEGLFAKDGQLHLVWTETTLRRSWSGEAVWHATVDLGTDEILVREVARSAQVDEPTLDGAVIAECSNGELHMFWNNGVGSQTGRFHQWWSPENLEWSVVEQVYPGLSGQTSKAGLVCDGTGRIHLITAANAAGESFAHLRYGTWFDGTWSDYDTLWEGRYSGERPWLAIVGGSQLHLLWHALPDFGGIRGDFIVHSHRQLAYDPTVEAVAAPELSGPNAPKTPAQTEQPVTERTTMLPSGTDSVQFDPRHDGGFLAMSKPILLAVVSILPVLTALVLASVRRAGRSRR